MTEPLGNALLALCLILVGALNSTPAPASQEAEAVSQFTWVDVWLDSGSEPLAAWQVELRTEDSAVQIVGIEGGEPTVFRDPPRYDPRALRHQLVILAAFSTAPLEELPTGRVRVARVHLEVRGQAVPDFTINAITAGREDGREIAVTPSLVKGR